MFNPNELTVEQLKTFLENNGYIHTRFDEFGDIAYSGYNQKRHSHSYLVVVKNTNEGNWDVTYVYVTLGNNGKICADYPGMSEADFANKAEANEYVNQAKYNA